MEISLSDNARDIKSDELKQHLLNVVKQENFSYSDLAERFYGDYQKDAEGYLKVMHDVIGIIDRVLNAGDWDSSLFLRNTVKPMKLLREQALEAIEFLNAAEDASLYQPAALEQDAVVIYVSLFQNQGDDLSKWALQLRSLSRYVLGRPIYANEEDVKKLIRVKVSRSSEAYVAVAIDKQFIQGGDVALKRTDRHGSALLNLAPGAIKTSNIREFVHMDKHYYFYDGKLKQKN